MDIVGIDPTTSRMRTTRSTTEPNALTDDRDKEQGNNNYDVVVLFSFKVKMSFAFTS